MDHLTCLCFSPPLNLLAFSSSLFFFLLPSSIHPFQVELFICYANSILGRERVWTMKWLCAWRVVSNVASIVGSCCPCVMYMYICYETQDIVNISLYCETHSDYNMSHMEQEHDRSRGSIPWVISLGLQDVWGWPSVTSGSRNLWLVRSVLKVQKKKRKSFMSYSK